MRRHVQFRHHTDDDVPTRSPRALLAQLTAGHGDDTVAMSDLRLLEWLAAQDRDGE